MKIPTPSRRLASLFIALVACAVCTSMTRAAPATTRPAGPPRVVFVAAEQEYDAAHTLADFAKALEDKQQFKCTVLTSDSTTDIPGLAALDDADLLVMFLRRRELPKDQLDRFVKYFDSGRPLVALRTSSHAFQNWLEFDHVVLGGNYHNHYPANKGTVRVAVAKGADDHPILRGFAPYESNGSLYRAAPLADTAKLLLTGTWTDKDPEPIAWTNAYKGARVFYTSLGHPDDFKRPEFRRLLLNGVLWAMDKPTAGEK